MLPVSTAIIFQNKANPPEVLYPNNELFMKNAHGGPSIFYAFFINGLDNDLLRSDIGPEDAKKTQIFKNILDRYISCRTEFNVKHERVIWKNNKEKSKAWSIFRDAFLTTKFSTAAQAYSSNHTGTQQVRTDSSAGPARTVEAWPQTSPTKTFILFLFFVRSSYLY